MKTSTKRIIQLSYFPSIEYDFDAERNAIASILAGELLHDDRGCLPVSFERYADIRQSSIMHPLRIVDGAFIEQEVKIIKTITASPKDDYTEKEKLVKSDVDKMKYISKSIKEAMESGMCVDVIRSHMRWLDTETFNTAIKDLT